MNFPELKSTYSHFEWSKDLKHDYWIVHTINIYGKWAHVTFSAIESPNNVEQAESYLSSLETFRMTGQIKPMGRTVTLGKYAEWK